MSREVRRVPVGWKHPVEPNPYWEIQTASRIRRGDPASKLHRPDERFRGLHRDSISVAQATWDREQEEWARGEHEHQAFLLNYNSPEGYLNRDGTRDEPKPHTVYDEDGNTVIDSFFLTSIEQLIEVYPYSEYAGERPEAEDYMPDFDVPADDLGWCLYETVSEGCPVTPVFATAEELIDHLSTVGQDWDQQPMRRTAAEVLVSQGGSFGSMLSVGGVLYRSDIDADLIATRVTPPALTDCTEPTS